MANHRHPLADSFRASIDDLRLLTARLDDPRTRPAALPRFRSGLTTILRGEPRPSPELCRKIYDIQADLQRLLKSRRNEYAMVGKINAALGKAKALVEKPPQGER